MKKEWQVKTLDDLCDIARGGSPRPIEKFLSKKSDGVNWIKISDATASKKYIFETKEKIIPSGVSRSRLVKPGDFILSNSMSFGRPYIMRTSGCIHDGWLVLSDKSGLFDQDYLYHFLCSNNAYKQFDNLAAGSTVRNLNIDLAKRVRVPIPPLSEQKRIVAILDEVSDGIAVAVANAEQNLANSCELFDSYVNSVFAQSGNDWKKCNLEQVVHKTCSLSYGIVQPGEDVSGGLPVIRPTDLRTKIIYLTGLKRINPSLADAYKRTKLVGNELLLCVRGSTGTVSMAAKELAGSNVTRGIVPIRFEPTAVIQDFGYYIFISKDVQEQIKSATYGAALMQINIRDLRKISFSAPSIDVQRNLVGKLGGISVEVERLKAIYENKVAAIAELKQAILEKAFAGELTAQPERVLQEALV